MVAVAVPAHAKASVMHVRMCAWLSRVGAAVPKRSFIWAVCFGHLLVSICKLRKSCERLSMTAHVVDPFFSLASGFLRGF